MGRRAAHGDGMATLRPLLLTLGLLVSVLLSAAGTSPAVAAAPLPTPTRWPLPGAPVVERGFDPPPSYWGAGHRGVDLTGRVGEPVLAAAAGTVSYAGVLAGRGVVVVDHGAVRTTYEPVTATVGIGARVAAGTPIGMLTAGHGAHGSALHWGLRAGEEYLDPLLLAPSAGTGHYRLLPAAAVGQVRQRAAARAAPPSARTLGPAGSHGFTFPVAGPITSPYGMRFHPVLQVLKLHDGTDFGAGCGTPIRAPYSGTVVAEYYNTGYGNRLMLDHGRVDGRHVVSGFNHAIAYVVTVGDRVRPGQVIGYVGATGYTTGCHLHLMVWLDGVVTDPMTWY